MTRTVTVTMTCDRCGSSWAPPDGPVISDLQWMLQPEGRGGSMLSDMAHDLCRDCTAGFRAWWRNATGKP